MKIFRFFFLLSFLAANTTIADANCENELAQTIITKNRITAAVYSYRMNVPEIVAVISKLQPSVDSEVLDAILGFAFENTRHGKPWPGNYGSWEVEYSALATSKEIVIRIVNDFQTSLPSSIKGKKICSSMTVSDSERDIHRGKKGIGVFGITSSLYKLSTGPNRGWVIWNEEQQGTKRVVSFELHIPRD